MNPVPATPVPWSAVFGNDRRVEVEIGSGRGDTLLAAAAAAPATNFFAVEYAATAVAKLVRRAARHRLTNLRAIAADARCVIIHCVPDASVAAYHIYFPDPWPKTRHHHRRLVSRAFAPHLARTLTPGGALHLATDVHPLLEEFSANLEAAGLRAHLGAPPPPRPQTKYEKRYAGGGTHYARFTRPSLR